jgi:hypothetical protein
VRSNRKLGCLHEDRGGPSFQIGKCYPLRGRTARQVTHIRRNGGDPQVHHQCEVPGTVGNVPSHRQMPVVNDLVADRTNLCELAVRQLVKGLSVEAASGYPPKACTGRMKRQAMTPHAATARVITAIIGAHTYSVGAGQGRELPQKIKTGARAPQLLTLTSDSDVVFAQPVQTFHTQAAGTYPDLATAESLDLPAGTITTDADNHVLARDWSWVPADLEEPR